MKLKIASTIAEAVRFSLHHAVPFYLLGLVACLPTYLHSFVPQQTRTLNLPGGPHEALLPRPWWETDLAVPAIEAVLLGIMVAIMVHMRQRDCRGEPVTVLPSLAGAAPRLPTVIAVSLTLQLAATLAAASGTSLGTFGYILFLLFLAPAMALYLVFCVAIPCAAVGDAGVINAFRRSAALTDGSRGRLFGIFGVFFLPLFLAVVVVVWLFRDTVFLGGFPALGFWLFGAAVVVYFSALIVVIHEALVALKEGAGAGTLATVFD